MKQSTRREFIKTSTVAAAALSVNMPMNFKSRPLLSFSTLGCPDWTFDEILKFAADHDYDGLELRGILRELDLTKRAEFNNTESIKSTKQKLADKKLKLSDLGSSCALHHPEGAERQKNLDEGKRFIDLAQNLGCPNVRVFPNELPKDDTRAAVIERIIQGLQLLGDYAKNTNVSVLMESHGDAVKTNELKQIMSSAGKSNVGLVWDIVNMWSVTKEPPADVYAQLKPYIRHTHIKDAKMIDDKPNYVFVGTGDTPILQAVDLLYKDGYKGYYSFEWEKLWHPDIAASDEAIASYSKTMRARLK
ncbi:MAG: sugar phosphate isomerase/epimerase family protein [Chitinophagaceae bacterium]